MREIPKAVRQKVAEYYKLFGTEQHKLWSKTLQLTAQYYMDHGYDPDVDIGYSHYYKTLLRPLSTTDDYVDPSQFLLSLQHEKSSIGTDFLYSVGRLKELDTSTLMMGRQVFQSEKPTQEHKNSDISNISSLKRQRDQMEEQLKLNSDLCENDEFMTALAHLREVSEDLTYISTSKPNINNKLEQELAAASTEVQTILVELEGGRNRWCETVSKGRSIVFLDTTHGTNKFGYHLGFWSVIAATGVTFPVAYSLQRLQKTEFFADLYHKFESIFGVQPEVICTDRDARPLAGFPLHPQLNLFLSFCLNLLGVQLI